MDVQARRGRLRRDDGSRQGFPRRLAEVAEIRTPEILTEQVSADGTRKWLLKFEGGQAIEMVFIPEPGRGTLCISSQVGCAMDCSFCSTAQQGFNRNLTAAEIVGQVWLANRELGYEPGGDRVITNVVFMGMGEPLANYRNVVPAAEILMDDLGLDLSRRRVTVSTSGLVPQMLRIADETNVALAVSLHAPNDELRNETRADQSQAPDRGPARGLLALRREAERAQRHVRIRDARRRQRQAAARARTRAAAARPSGQGQPDSVQSVSRHALPALERGRRSNASATC